MSFLSTCCFPDAVPCVQFVQFFFMLFIKRRFLWDKVPSFVHPLLRSHDGSGSGFLHTCPAWRFTGRDVALRKITAQMKQKQTLWWVCLCLCLLCVWWHFNVKTFSRKRKKDSRRAFTCASCFTTEKPSPLKVQQHHVLEELSILFRGLDQSICLNTFRGHFCLSCNTFWTRTSTLSHPAACLETRQLNWDMSSTRGFPTLQSLIRVYEAEDCHPGASWSAVCCLSISDFYRHPCLPFTPSQGDEPERARRRQCETPRVFLHSAMHWEAPLALFAVKMW